jgi:hypothetical protein
LPVFPFDKVLGIVESAKTFLNSERNAAPDVEQRKKQAEKKGRTFDNPRSRRLRAKSGTQSRSFLG